MISNKTIGEMTSSALTIFASVFVCLSFITLLFLRYRSSAVTMFDCALTMLTIGVYSLTQLLFVYFKYSDLKQDLASTTISAFYDVDPTNKVKKMFQDSISKMKPKDYLTKVEQIQSDNKAVMLRSGAFVFAIVASGLGLLSLLYHLAFEKRNRLDVPGSSEVCVFGIQILGSVGFAVLMNFVLVKKAMCLYSKDAVNSCLNGIKQGLSFNLINIWNSNPELRENLRQVPDVSKTVDTLNSSLSAVSNDTQILSSSLSSLSSDVKTNLQSVLTDLSGVVESLKQDLVKVKKTPCDSGTSATGDKDSLQHLKSLAVVASRLAKFKTGKADVDVLVQNLWKSCRLPLTSLKDLSAINLCDSYQTTRDVLVKLEKYCSNDDNHVSMSRRLSDNLNVVITTLLGSAVLAFGGARLLGNNMKTVFNFSLMTALALCVYQICIVDFAKSLGSTVDDWRMLLYSTL